jgi:UDP-N-acetylglucosamine transferase subunit ALG13
VTTLLVASSGGHLKQLQRLVPRFGDLGDVVWVTFDTAQSRSLLAGQEVVFAHNANSRDLPGAARNARLAFQLLRTRRFKRVISTGSNVAVSFLPLAAALGCRTHYIESASRVTGPSLTGRLLRRAPGVRLYSQWEATWARPPWRYRGSVFEGFEAASSPATQVRRLVVSVGSSEFYGFRRLIERMVAIVPPGVEVLWQTGRTAVDDLAIAARPTVPGQELESALADADAVVCHCGTGSALSALEAGRCPVLVPRRPDLGEIVDDHQEQIGRYLSAQSLGISKPAEALTFDDVETAASRRVIQSTSPPAFALDE